MLERIGYVDAVIARETPDGLMLIDGHLRTDLTTDAEIPVLVVDLDEAEAGEVLATLDPLAAMAETDTKALQSLVSGLASQADEALSALLGNAHRLNGTAKEEDPLAEEPEPKAKRGQVWQQAQVTGLRGQRRGAQGLDPPLHRRGDQAVGQTRHSDPGRGQPDLSLPSRAAVGLTASAALVATRIDQATPVEVAFGMAKKRTIQDGVDRYSA